MPHAGGNCRGKKFMDKNNFFIKSEIRSNIQTISTLLNTGVFSSLELRVFQEPVFVSIILKLDDLLQKLRILNQRIIFKDDISKGDITDLVNKIRNAICHLDSPENLLDKESYLKFVFSIVIGKGNAVQVGNDIVAKSDYSDDIAFFYGEHHIYLKRHIVRTLKESMDIFKKLYPNERI